MVAANKRNEQVLRNIIMLRAYAIAAHDEAVSMKYEHSQMGKSVVGDLLLRLGGDKIGPNEKSKIVRRYAKAVALCISRFQVGVGKYLIRRITKAMLHGHGIVAICTAHGLTMVGLDHKALGFVSRPGYISRLGVRIDEYVRAKHKITKLAMGADNEAALSCLIAGKISQLRSFYHQIKAKYHHHKTNFWKKMVDGAEAGERMSYRKHHHLGKQATAGWKSAQNVLSRILKYQASHHDPSKAQMKKEAKAMALRWLKNNKHSCDVKDIIRKDDKKAQGCVAMKTKNEYKYHNTKICIRDQQQGRCLASATNSKGFIHPHKSTKFYITRRGSVMTIQQRVKSKHKTRKGLKTLLKWGGYGRIKASYLSVSTGWGAKGQWLVCDKTPRVVPVRKTYCELFHKCAKGDGTNFSTFVKKKKGFKYYKGACTHPGKKLAKKVSLKLKSIISCKMACKAKKWCQGVSMPKVALKKKAKKKTKKGKKAKKKVKKKALTEAIAVTPLQDEGEDREVDEEKKQAEDAAAEAEKLQTSAAAQLKEEGA